MCGKAFVRKGTRHSCVVVPLSAHFAARPRAEELFQRLETAIREVGGPFRLSIAKTRIGLVNGITFAAVMPRKDHIRFHFVLKRRIDSGRILRVDHYEPWFVHTLKLRTPEDLDEELLGWLGESYQLGLR